MKVNIAKVQDEQLLDGSNLEYRIVNVGVEFPAYVTLINGNMAYISHTSLTESGRSIHMFKVYRIEGEHAYYAYNLGLKIDQTEPVYLRKVGGDVYIIYDQNCFIVDKESVIISRFSEPLITLGGNTYLVGLDDVVLQGCLYSVGDGNGNGLSVITNTDYDTYFGDYRCELSLLDDNIVAIRVSGDQDDSRYFYGKADGTFIEMSHYNDGTDDDYVTIPTHEGLVQYNGIAGKLRLITLGQQVYYHDIAIGFEVMGYDANILVMGDGNTIEVYRISSNGIKRITQYSIPAEHRNIIQEGYVVNICVPKLLPKFSSSLADISFNTRSD